MSLFVLASKDGWVNIMYHGLDAVGIDQQVGKDTHCNHILVQTRIYSTQYVCQHVVDTQKLLYLSFTIYLSISTAPHFGLVCSGQTKQPSCPHCPVLSRESQVVLGHMENEIHPSVYSGVYTQLDVPQLLRGILIRSPKHLNYFQKKNIHSSTYS